MPDEDALVHSPDEFPLGAIPSPTDPRDFPLSALYDATGILAAAVTVPSTYTIPAIPAVSNQDSTPMCVAHSEAYEKLHQDLLDQGLFAPDRSKFFYAIGGGPGGAVGRNGLSRLLHYGYDVVGGSAEVQAEHKIAAYYAVPITQADIEAAIYSFGGVLFGVDWPHSWFHPNSYGSLPAPDYSVGGHFIYAVGYDSGGVWWQNSWGTAYGVNGRVKVPWRYLGRAFEAWKTVDVLEWVARKAKCPGTVRKGPGIGYPVVGSFKAGDVAMCAAGQAVAGSSWTLDCGGTKTGTGWWRIRAVNGVPAQALYGVPYVYAATGRF